MVPTTNLRDDIQFLAAKPEPLWLLRHLCDEPTSLKNIADALLLPISTIQPLLDELMERQWVKHTGEGYRITSLGAFVTMEYLEFLNTLEEINESEQFIQELPIEAISSVH